MLKNVYGIDVGNYDSKSALTSVSSAYTTSRTQPVWEEEYLYWNGNYYIPSSSRPAIVKDKTSADANDRAMILTLMAIGKETLARLEKKHITQPQEIQEAINKIQYINLGAGLPPRYMSKEMAEKNKNYYLNNMQNGISFQYSGYNFNFALKNVEIFPQGLLPTIFYTPDTIKKYSKYYGIDIGGYTVDVILIANGKADFEKTITIELGVLPLYEKIIERVMIECDATTLDHINIEDVLMNKEHILTDNIVTVIHECTRDWVNNIINTLTLKGVNLKTYPSCWSGGGSQLFKTHIDNNKMVAEQHDFIKDVRANAKSYQQMLQAKYSKK